MTARSRFFFFFKRIVAVALILALVNLGSNALLSFDRWRNARASSQDLRYQLPNYAGNRETAELHFKELGQLRTAYAASVGWRHESFQGATINIDANGSRTHTISPADGNSQKPTYFFGGSAMWGEGVPDDETIPAQYSRLSGHRTYNEGMLGYTSRQSLARFIDLLSQGKSMGAAVFYDGINDVHCHCQAHLEVNEHAQTDFIRHLLKTHGTGGSPFADYLDQVFFSGTREVGQRVLAKFDTSLTNVDDFYICDNSEERARRVATALVTNWEIAHDVAAARGIRFFAVLQPVAFIGNPKIDHIDGSSVAAGYALTTAWNAERGAQFKTVYPSIRKLIEARRHRWILDYTDAFSRDEYVYIDFAHTSANGASIIAHRLYADIDAFPKPQAVEESTAK